MDDLLLKEKTCLLCSTKFKSARVRRSKQYMLKRDSDFCTYYRGENPIFYGVFVCPQCGYGFSDNFKSPWPEKKEVIKTKTAPPKDDLGKIRSLEKAAIAYQTALKCALMGEERNSIIAGLYLHLAWLNRFQENKSKELENLEKALEYYEKAIEQDRELENPATIFYLIGELSSRLGDDRKAIKFFAYIINNKEINDPNIIRMSRERWQEIRAERR